MGALAQLQVMGRLCGLVALALQHRSLYKALDALEKAHEAAAKKAAERTAREAASQKVAART